MGGRMSSHDAKVRGYVTTLKLPSRRFALLNTSFSSEELQGMEVNES